MHLQKLSSFLVFQEPKKKKKGKKKKSYQIVNETESQSKIKIPQICHRQMFAKKAWTLSCWGREDLWHRTPSSFLLSYIWNGK